MKARNREINIFNMSLLDILCGALGAFCFMMLSLLPYYRTPGEDIRINEEQKKLLESVQDIKDLAERLKNAKSVEDLSELVKQLQEKILALENEIKQLQGRVNSLLAENDELKNRVQSLEEENRQLVAQNRQLREQNQQLTDRNQQLEAQNEQLLTEKQALEAENKDLKIDLDRSVPWVVGVVSVDPGQRIGCVLHEVKLVAKKSGKRQPPFDPAAQSHPAFWPGDTSLPLSGGAALFVSSLRSSGSETRLYAYLQNDEHLRKRTVVDGWATGEGLPSIRVPPFPLTPERPWALVGTFVTSTVDGRVTIKFIEATAEERDKEWLALTGRQPPKSDEPAKPSPASAVEAEERSRREEAIRRAKESAASRTGGATGGVDLATANRLRNFVVAYTGAKTDAEKQQIVDRALKDAADDKERMQIMSMVRNLTSGQAAPPANGGTK